MEKLPGSDIPFLLRRWITGFALAHTAIMATLIIGGFVAVTIVGSGIARNATLLEVSAQQGTRLADILIAIRRLEGPITLSESYKGRQNVSTLLSDFVKEAGKLDNIPASRRTVSQAELDQALREPAASLGIAVTRFEQFITQRVLKSSGRVDPVTAQTIEDLVQYQVAPRLNATTFNLADNIETANTMATVTRLGGTMVALLGLLGFTFVFGNQTARKVQSLFASQIEDPNERANRYDETTGLPNRDQLASHLKDLCNLARKNELRAAVLQVRTHLRTKSGGLVSRTMRGDIYREMGNRVSSVCRGGDFIACIAPGEFFVAASTFEDHRALQDLAEAIETRIKMTLNDPVFDDIQASCAIGVAFLDSSSATPQALMNNVNVALNEAERSEFGDIQFYSSAVASNSSRREQMRDELLVALKNDQVIPYFQPVFSAGSKQLVGVEALARWDHPELGLLAPIQFLNIAEEFDLSQFITRAVLDHAIEAIKAWEHAGHEIGQLSINVTAAQLRDSLFVDDVGWILDSCKFDASRVALEISEDEFVSLLQEDAVRAMQRLADLGFLLCIDDFGAGHVDVKQLKQLPVRKVKIDRAFVANIDTANEQRAWVESILKQASKLDVVAVAEGVETDAESRMLQKLGCHEMQGFFLAQPMPASQMLDWLEKTDIAKKPTAA